MEMRSHRDLDAWKIAISLATETYTVTREYPKEEIYGLVAQMRRAAVSIASNIAEGAARSGNREFTKFLYIAAGSASELDTQIEISRSIGLGDKQKLDALQNTLRQEIRLVHGLIRSIKARAQ